MADEIERTEDGRPMLNFPSMDEKEDDTSDSDYHYTNYDDDDADDDPVADKKYKMTRDAVGNSDEFYFNPDQTQEQMNRDYCAKELDRIWGSDTQQNLEIVKHLVDSYVDRDIAVEVNSTGLGSHPLMLQRIFETGQKLQREAVEAYGTSSRTISGKNMNALMMKKMGEKAREDLNRAIHHAKTEIIKLHGAIPSW